jgi:hypothetical protein
LASQNLTLEASVNIEDRLIAFFLRKPEYFKYCVSSLYPLTENQIHKYKDDLIWFDDSVAYAVGQGLSTNCNLPWSKELIKKYEHNWNWESFSSWIIGKAFWHDEILSDYAERLNWDSVSWNGNIPWDEELIWKHRDQINWDYLSMKNMFKWTPQMLDRFESYVNWERMSNNNNNPWTRGHSNSYMTYEDRFTIQSTIDSLEKYEDRLDWSVMFLDWNNGISRVKSDKIIDVTLRLLK